MILIASSSLDSSTHEPVYRKLRASGESVVLYETDRVMSGEQRFVLKFADDGTPLIWCDGIDIRPGEVAAAWLWKVGSFRNADATTNVSKQLSMVNEMVLWNSSIWDLYSEDVWLNAPSRIAAADRKLSQLSVARSLGLAIPETVVSSTWDDLGDSSLCKEATSIIVKMLRGVIADQNEIRAMYTEVLTADRLQALQRVARPFPGLYQAFIQKAREWRVTLVGDQVFAVAIYTEESAKDDWRRHQLTSAVQFRNERIPDVIADQCRQFLSYFKLNFGAFDLIETSDGRFVFLECNPNGQYAWLEDELGIDVSGAIAAKLLDIARRRT